MDSEQEFIAIARIVRTRGIRGEVLADLWTDRPERFATVREVRVERADGSVFELELERYWFQQTQIVLKFRDCHTVEDADRLRGGTVRIRSDQLIPLHESEFFHFQLVGCLVKTLQGQEIGHVRQIMETGAAPLLVVTSQSSDEYLIPFTDSICPDVDVRSQTIVIDPPDGLLELNKR